MEYRQDISKFIQTHLVAAEFDYDLVVDWAIDLIRAGKETENILMLASFSKPVDAREIRPYLRNVLHDLGLKEIQGEAAVLLNIRYRLIEILNGHELRKHLASLYKLCCHYEYAYDLMPFYLIHYGWIDLDDTGINFYCEGNNAAEIYQVLKREAQVWLNQHTSIADNNSVLNES